MGTDLSKKKLLEKLHASDRPVSARQLERWWKAGHMDRPERRHLVGQRGSVSVFSARAFDQAAALYDATQPRESGAPTDRRLDERAFLLWWSGKPIAQDPRQLTLRLASPLLKAIEAIKAYRGTPVLDFDPRDSEAEYDAVERYFQEHPPEQLKGQLFRTLFRNLGRRPDDMLSVVFTMTVSAMGHVPLIEASGSRDEPSLATLVLKALGLGEFQSDLSEEAQVDAVLRNISAFSDRETISNFVLARTDEEMNTARRYASALLEGLPAIFELQSVLFEKKSTARLMHAFSKMTTTGLKAAATIGIAWLLHKESPENGLRLVEQIEQEAPRARGLCSLARAYPQYRELFLSKNLARLAELPEDKKRDMYEYIMNAMK